MGSGFRVPAFRVLWFFFRVLEGYRFFKVTASLGFRVL